MSFKEDGWVVVKGFLSKDELKQMYKDCKKEDKTSKELDGQCPLSPSFYNSKFVKVFLKNSLHSMEKHTKLKLFTTYSFWRWYLTGELLLFHSDRQACEISATIFIGGDPWEIHIRSYDGTSHVVKQELGDALIYRGHDLKHWREEFEGEHHAQIFLHYVDQDGPYTEHKGDKLNGQR